MGRKGRCMTQALTIRLESVIFFFLLLRETVERGEGRVRKGVGNGVKMKQMPLIHIPTSPC